MTLKCSSPASRTKSVASTSSSTARRSASNPVPDMQMRARPLAALPGSARWRGGALGWVGVVGVAAFCRCRMPVAISSRAAQTTDSATSPADPNRSGPGFSFVVLACKAECDSLENAREAQSDAEVRVEAAVRPREAPKGCEPARSDDKYVIRILVGQRPFWPTGRGGWWRVGRYAGFCPEPRGSVAAIHLGRRLPAGSSGLPGSDRAGSPLPAWPCSGWGLPSRPGRPGRWCALTAPFHPYLCAVARAIGGLLSVALSCESPRLGVTQHRALWSPDVPRTDRVRTRPPGRLATTAY